MIGRREFGLTGLAAAAALAMEKTGFAQNPFTNAKPSEGHAEHGGAFAKCAEACSDCQRECDSCAHHCATRVADGEKHHMSSLQTCLDCADFCGAASRITSREGVFASLICESCAEACARCGKECEKHAGDKTMARCAEECRKCENACREMLKEVAKFS
jgi:hypothetical protein